MAQYNALWLPDALASERPSAPGKGRYLYRATDTGAVSYWDGSAWRTVYNPTVNATQLQGRTLASTAPTTGQAIVWSGTQWEPGTVSTSPTTTSEAMSGSGWTSSGSGTHSETWDGSKLDLAITSSAGSAAVTKAGVLGSGDEYDVLVRFSMPTNNNTAQEQLYLAAGSASNKNTALAIKSNGSFDASRTNGGYVSIASPGGGPTGTQLTDGNSWLRLSKRSGVFCWYWARGTGGARPVASAWDLVTAPSTNEAVNEAAGGDALFIGALTDASLTILFRVHEIQHCRPGAL
mgnify:CR=1 FL=1